MAGRERRSRPRRPELSQHFLAEPTARRLIATTSITPADLVVEIGAGRGALTKWLARRTANLIAVEVDVYLAQRLSTQFDSSVQVVAEDFLHFALPDSPFRVVGNIPYAHSTAIVRKLLQTSNPPTDAWLVVEQGFAWRLCGLPYTQESPHSLLLKPHWHLEIVGQVARNEFNPPPKVQSAFLHCLWRERPLLENDEYAAFQRLVRAGFSKPTLPLALKPWLSKLQLRRLAAEHRFDLEAPPGAIQFIQWLAIHRFLQHTGDI